MSFNWQKDEEEWQENSPADGSENTAVSRWRSRLIIWGITLILLVLAGWFVYQQANRRMETAVAQTESQLLASHQFIIQAAGNQDRELLRVQLSGRDQSWTDAQILLGEEKILFNRPQFNLSWQPENNPTVADIEVNFNPELNSAEVTYPLTYLPHGGGEAILLQGTAVYRRGAEHWLMSPPEAAFWGEERETQTANITLTYPERDEETAVRLAVSLQNGLDKMCQLPDVTCPPDLELPIRLSTHPDSLLNLAKPSTVRINDMELPTPTLVGLPVDEAGYEAIANGYAVQMVTAVLSDLAAYECCQHQLFHHALMDWQLNALELQTWPMTPLSYGHLMLEGVTLPLWRELWMRETDATENWQAAYALVEYLQTQIVEPVSVAKLQQEITAETSFTAWLEAANSPTSPNFINADFRERWNTFILEQVVNGGKTAVSPIPYPTEPLQISCQTDDNRVTILAYDPASDQWQETYTQNIELGRFGSILPIPDSKDSYLVTERMYDDAQASRFFLVENNQVTASFTVPLEIPDLFGYFYANSSPDLRYMLLAGYATNLGPPDYRLLDMSACLSGNCQTQSVSGFLRWSSNGAQTLFTDAEENITTPFSPPSQSISFFLGDETGEHAVKIGQGAYPFWLDENTYGYYMYFEDDGQLALVTAVIDKNQPRLVQSATELRQHIPADSRPDMLSIAYAHPLHNHSQRVIVYATDPNGHGYQFLLTMNDDLTAVITTDLLHISESTNDGEVIDISANGRWQILYDYDYGASDPGPLITLTKRGENSGDFTPFTFPSTGTIIGSGDWFSSVSENILLLAAPAYNYRQYIPHDLSGCTVADWP